MVGKLGVTRFGEEISEMLGRRVLQGKPGDRGKNLLLANIVINKKAHVVFQGLIVAPENKSNSNV